MCFIIIHDINHPNWSGAVNRAFSNMSLSRENIIQHKQYYYSNFLSYKICNNAHLSMFVEENLIKIVVESEGRKTQNKPHQNRKQNNPTSFICLHDGYDCGNSCADWCPKMIGCFSKCWRICTFFHLADTLTWRVQTQRAREKCRGFPPRVTVMVEPFSTRMADEQACQT